MKSILLHLIIIGPQGSGKGTHAKALAAKMGIAHVSTGELLRSMASQETEDGKKVRAMLAAGTLFPDDFMLKILRERLKEKDAQKGFILDGFPRTAKQARMLDSVAKIDRVLYLNVSDGECVRRLGGRNTCESCGAIYGNENPPKQAGKCDACGSALHVREDDREEAIMKRLRLYHEQTEPILDFYRKSGILIEVSVKGIRQPEEVFRDICDALEVE